MTKIRIILLAVLLLFIAAYFLFDAGRFFTLDFFRTQQAGIESRLLGHPLASRLVYLCLYIFITALSLPAAGILSLAGGALFGLLWGTILVSFGSTIGATLAFLASRFLFRDLILTRYGDKLVAVNDGIREEGAYYLFTLRLIPLFPFFLINVLMGLTPIRTLPFFLVSQAGMLPATIIYVNAGTQLAAIEHPGDVFSPELIASLALLGLFPLLARKIVHLLRTHRARNRPEMTDGEDLP